MFCGTFALHYGDTQAISKEIFSVSLGWELSIWVKNVLGMKLRILKFSEDSD